MQLIFKTLLQKLNFIAGRNPYIESRKDYRRYVPDSYKTVLLISADFELAWAWRYTKSSTNPLVKALGNARQERMNIPLIVDLCNQYNIPITWATVGHLFLESCKRINGIAHKDIPRLTHFENNFWKYSGKDWFENDPCSNYKDAPEWYCPDLIRMLLKSSVKHEIGCHTFSHIDCRDVVCSPKVMRSELAICKQLAKEFGIELKSFVHPGYTIGNLSVLAEEGFTNFRTNERNVLGYPKKHLEGLWEFEQTAEFAYKKEWSINYHIHRYVEIIKRAMKSNTICVLWFHPSFDPIMVERILPEVFGFIDENREKIWVTTHTEYVNWLENKWKQ